MRIMLASGNAAVDFEMFSAPRAHWLGEEKKMETQSRNDNVARVFGMSSAGRKHWPSERRRQEKKMETQSRNNNVICDWASEEDGNVELH